MTREYHLGFCKQCVKKAFSSKKGIVCSLTGEHAAFEDDCPDYEEDTAVKTQLLLEKQAKEERELKKDTLGLSSFGVKNRKVASYILITGGLAWIVLGLVLLDRVFFWPIFLFGFGVYLYIKTGKTESLEKNKDESALDDLDI